MFSATVNNIAFLGKTRFLSCNSEGKSKTVSDCPFGTAYFGDTRGLSDFVKKHSYPTASIEETIGKIHDNQTYRIYIADPQENVSDAIRQNHDYIVHDIEPCFPDIKAYFGAEHQDIAKGFKTVSDYYKRLENKGFILGDKDTVNRSKNKLNIVDMCIKIFNADDDLREKRIKLESRTRFLTSLINETEANIPVYQKELERKNKYLAKNEKDLEKKEIVYNKLKEQRLLLKDKLNKTIVEIKTINSKIEKYEVNIKSINTRIQKYKNRIKFLEEYIENAPNKIENWNNEIKYLQKQVSDIKQALIPNFKKLQDFYTINGIKIIKRI